VLPTGPGLIGGQELLDTTNRRHIVGMVVAERVRPEDHRRPGRQQRGHDPLPAGSE
jgi:hypothetical protein